MELMGVDLQVDPYFVESEGEDDGLFGDAAAAAGSPAAAAAEGVDAPDAAEDAEAETAKVRFLPGPLKPPNFKQKTTVPPGTFRSGAGAASTCAHAEPAKNIAGGKTSETSAYSLLITSTWTRQAFPWPETPCGLERR